MQTDDDHLYQSVANTSKFGFGITPKGPSINLAVGSAVRNVHRASSRLTRHYVFFGFS